MRNNYIIEGDVTRLFINHKGKIVESLIDTDDFHIADSFRGTWTGSQYKKNGQIYVTGTNHNQGDRISLKLHRLIVDAPSGYVVDHINRNGLDNRKSNLRIVDLSENAQNLSISSVNTTGYRGVSFHKEKQKYKAYLTVNKRQKHVGYFDTAEEANKAVINARRKYLPYSFEGSQKVR